MNVQTETVITTTITSITKGEHKAKKYTFQIRMKNPCSNQMRSFLFIVLDAMHSFNDNQSVHTYALKMYVIHMYRMNSLLYPFNWDRPKEWKWTTTLFRYYVLFHFLFFFGSWVFVLNLNWCWIWNNKNPSKIIYCERGKSGLWSPRDFNVNCECIDFDINILFAVYLCFILMRLMWFLSSFYLLIFFV